MRTKTLIQEAVDDNNVAPIERVAEKERMDINKVREEVADGRVVIPANIRHSSLDAVGIGRTLSTKINANIGKSSVSGDEGGELRKLRTAVEAGADAVMDLSTGDDVGSVRESIVKNSTAPVGTVPIYEAVSRAGSVEALTVDLLFDVIYEQAEQGVDFMTVHAGFLFDYIPKAQQRLLGIVSRGGGILAKWMREYDIENPLYAHFDRLLRICQEFDVTLSLGDGLRPGCLADASDDAQFAELDTLGVLVGRARDDAVQAMVEGPGHIPIDQIEMNIRKEIETCADAPFYILGPVVTDAAPGYDHISSGIGATLGAYYGAAMLCYITPKEHLGLPNEEDVRQGVVTYKLAAHAADIGNGVPGERERDDTISKARAEFDWEKQMALALDPHMARSIRQEAEEEGRSDREEPGSAETKSYCSMCGPEFCPMRITHELEGQGSK